MTETQYIGEGKVSGNQASIPAHIREKYGISDGDVIRWRIVDGDLEVEVVREKTGVFEGFEPGESSEKVDSVEEHDLFGADTE